MSAIRQLEGVTDVHHAHAWSLTSGRNVFSSHVCVGNSQEGERVLRQASNLLRQRFNIYSSTIQIEEYCLDGEDSAAEIDIMQSHTGPERTRGGKVHDNQQAETPDSDYLLTFQRLEGAKKGKA